MLTVNTNALRAIRAIDPDPLYLIHIMFALGLIGPSRCADAEYISSSAGWDRRRTLSSLKQLSSPSLRLVDRVNYRAWCVSESAISESTQNVLSQVVVVFNNIEYLINTTTTAESTQCVLSELPADYDHLIKRLQGLSVALPVAKKSLLCAANRGEMPSQINKYIDDWVVHKQSTEGRGIIHIGALIAKRMEEGTAAPSIAHLSPPDYSGYDKFIEGGNEEI